MRRYPSSSGLFLSKETVGSPKFVSYPSMHMPRSWIPVVSRWLAFFVFGTAAFHVNQRVGFLRSRGLSFQTTILQYFRDSVSRPAHSLPLWLPFASLTAAPEGGPSPFGRLAHPLSGIALRFRYSPAGYALT